MLSDFSYPNTALRLIPVNCEQGRVNLGTSAPVHRILVLLIVQHSSLTAIRAEKRAEWALVLYSLHILSQLLFFEQLIVQKIKKQSDIANVVCELFLDSRFNIYKHSVPASCPCNSSPSIRHKFTVETSEPSLGIFIDIKS